jgi:hypothetical protein
LLLSGTARINLAQSFPEIFSFVSFKDLFLKVRPVKFGVRFSINGDNDPFEDIVGLGFSVFDFDFSEDISINFGCDLDSFFPFSEVLFLMDFDLFFILIFFIVIFKIPIIDFDLVIQVVSLSFQFMDGFGALSFVQIEFGKNGIDSMSKTLNFGSFRLNRINVFVDELGRQVSKRFFKVGKFWRVVSN